MCAMFYHSNWFTIYPNKSLMSKKRNNNIQQRYTRNKGFKARLVRQHENAMVVNHRIKVLASRDQFPWKKSP